MLAVNSEHVPSPMDNHTQEAEIEPTLSEVDATPLKQQTKKKLLTPLNILIILAALALVGLGSYYLYSLSQGGDMKNKINETHDKIITVADSSSQKGSNTGSSSSKSSSNNNKPNGRSQPADKKVISSNPKLTGGSPPNGGGDDEDEDNNSGKKNSGSGGGSSTEVDSNEDSEEEESEEDNTNEPIVWVDTKAPSSATSTPNVGSTRTP